MAANRSGLGEARKRDPNEQVSEQAPREAALKRKASEDPTEPTDAGTKTVAAVKRRREPREHQRTRTQAEKPQVSIGRL